MTVKAEATIFRNRILIETSGADWDHLLARCRSVGSGRFVRVPRKAWSYPLTAAMCHRLREVWGESLVINNDLASWYRVHAAEALEQAQLSRDVDATLVRLPTVAPLLAATLRPDQRVGVAWLAKPYRSAALLADEPGCGKTLEMIGGILEADLNGPILIACPRLSVRLVWARELKRWAPDESVHVARGTRAQRTRAIAEFMADTSPRKWLVTVAETLRIVEEFKDEQAALDNKKSFTGYEYPTLFDTYWAAVIVDESHKAFGSLTVVKGTLMGKGFKRLETERRYALTGTPFGKGGRLQGFFGTLHWMWPDEFTSFWRWAETNFEIEDKVIDRFGKTAKQIGELRGGKSEETFLADLGPRILRRTKAEVLPWLPAKEYREVLCEMTPAQTKQYKALDRDGEFAAGDGVISADGVLAALTRGKQIADGAVVKDSDGKVKFNPTESGKIDTLMQLLEQRGILDDSGSMKVIVASQFNEFLFAIQTRLDKVTHHFIRGEVSDATRDKMVEEFQAFGGPRVLLLNAATGGVSITLDAADEMHMMDEMWDPGANTQLEDRIHRASRGAERMAATVLQYRSVGTIDTAIGEDVEAKRIAQHAVLDGRRGMDYLRTVIRYRPEEKED